MIATAAARNLPVRKDDEPIKADITDFMILFLSCFFDENSQSL
jgi:hypothetical protein